MRWVRLSLRVAWVEGPDNPRQQQPHLCRVEP